jgi:hypothetical protein
MELTKAQPEYQRTEAGKGLSSTATSHRWFENFIIQSDVKQETFLIKQVCQVSSEVRILRYQLRTASEIENFIIQSSGSESRMDPDQEC